MLLRHSRKQEPELLIKGEWRKTRSRYVLNVVSERFKGKLLEMKIFFFFFITAHVLSLAQLVALAGLPHKNQVNQKSLQVA